MLGLEHRFIKNLKENDLVQGVYLVNQATLLKSKAGSLYISAVLCDKTGSIDARMWDANNELKNKINAGEFVKLKGQVKVYRESNQIIIQNIETVDETKIDITDYLPTANRNLQDMYDELISIVNTINDTFIKTLLLNTLEDETIKPHFMRVPAAKSIHHAYIGGLLEHVLSICNLMLKISDHYKILNKDLLLFGAIYHDIGKVWELSYKTQFQYTDVGRLVGHITLASELIEKKSSEIKEFPEKLKNILKHIVLSHHGKLEFGSPKRPKFLEAFVLHYVDDLDSKMYSIGSIIKDHKEKQNNWTTYSEMYDRYFYTETYDT